MSYRGNKLSTSRNYILNSNISSEYIDDLTNNDMSITLNLLNILESLFFSMKIPPEIVNKYNLLKESAFTQLNIPFTPIEESKVQSK